MGLDFVNCEYFMQLQSIIEVLLKSDHAESQRRVSIIDRIANDSTTASVFSSLHDATV